MGIMLSLLRRLRIYHTKIQIPRSSMIVPPFRIEGGAQISVGAGTFINKYAWIAAYNLTGYEAKIVIGSRVRISYYCHIIATRSIKIGDSVNMGNGVYISDNAHGYEDVTCPVKDQPIVQKNNVSIGDGTWIGEHVCIIGRNIGKHCVIGANSVITSDIPDYCVVAGVPARIIKRYDLETACWCKVDNAGAFIKEG